MSYIQDIARAALSGAHDDLAKARRTLLLAAGVLALVHLLSVHPYLGTAREIAGAETSIAANATLLARLEPEILRLQQAERSAGTQLSGLLGGVTDEMIGRFADLRVLVRRALRGEPPVSQPSTAGAAPPSEIAPPPQMQMQQMPLSQQMQQADLPPSPIQAPLPNLPPMRQMPPQQMPMPAPGPYVAPGLEPILAALAGDEPDAYDRLIAYARTEIVADAYARAERAWSGRIRPAYLDALEATEESARRVAESAPGSAAATAEALLAAAAEMARQRSAVEAIAISHDNTVDEALGTDWWRTETGKGAYADAVAASIDQQMRQIAVTAEAPSTAIRETLALQEELRDQLQRRQEELEQQFAEQRRQLSALSGAGGVVPVDLASFIGLFPLVLGLVLGFLLLRAGQARRQAARSAEDLAAVVPAGPEDRETRIWLARRALGGGGALAPMAVTVLLALCAIAWIALAALQIAASPIDPPLAPWTSGALAVLLVLIAAGWDLAATRRLAATAQP